MGQEERRAHDRLPVRFGARVRVGDGPEFEGLVENLGSLGALVSTEDLEAPFEVGDEISLTILRPGEPDLEARGSVVRLEQEFAGGEIRRSFAVRFADEIDV